MNASIRLSTSSTARLELTRGELSDLKACEDVIRRGYKIFVKVGLALRRIRDGRLYRAHYATFEDYVKQWDVSRVYAYQIMEASAVVEEISKVSEVDRLPASVTQARELGRVKQSGLRCQIWQDVVDEANRNQVPITAKCIRAAVNARVPELVPVSPRPPSLQEFTISASREKVETMLGDLESGLNARDWERMESQLKKLRGVLESAPSPEKAIRRRRKKRR